MRYLSNTWIDAADAAVQAAAGSAPADPIIVDQHVKGARSYRIMIERNACSVAELTGGLGPADATFRQSLDTATAVAQGSTDAHQAFLLGQIRFEGNIDILIERRDAFTWLADVLAPVLAETTFG